jgi:hypothetical protein
LISLKLFSSPPKVTKGVGETWKDHDQNAIKFDNKIANSIKLKAVIPANSKWSVAKESVIFGTDN